MGKSIRNPGLIERLISQQFTLKGSGRYLKTEEHSSLVIDTKEGKFYWNSRNIVGDALTWLTKVMGVSYDKATQILKEAEDYEGTHVITIKRDGQETIVYPALVEAFWSRGRGNRSYWYKRLLNDETIDRFRLGYNDGWFAVPVFVDGTFRNFQIRRDEPDKLIKNWYSGVGPLLFNSDLLKVVDSVVLTEGPIDAILLNQYGIPAVSQTGGAGNWNNKWMSYFAYQKEIYLVYDNDEAGYKGAGRVARRLGETKCKIYTFDGYREGFDIVDFFLHGGSIEKFQRLLKNESKYVFER